MEKKRILIVEDEGLIALQLKENLENIGYELAGIFESGEESLEVMESLQPDLILMDIQLQGELNGIETARLIRKNYNVPVIYLTAHADEGIIKEAKTTEPYNYILKPYELRKLQIAIELALYKHQVDQDKDEITKELKNALETVKQLSGLLPICVSCKKIRDDRGYWKQIEDYIREHSEAEFSHGLCEECAKNIYPQYYEKIKEKE